jgi:hypothetical protein
LKSAASKFKDENQKNSFKEFPFLVSRFMKYKYTFLVVIALSTFLAVTSFAFMQDSSLNKLELTIETSKQSYQLGEPVDLIFALNNKSNQNIEIYCFGTASGDLQVHISEGKGTFLEYDAGWGTVDIICKNTLKPNDKIETSAKILWNHKIEESNLISSDVIKRAREGKIVSYYAFSKAGTYFIKALALNVGTTRVESKPIKIKIEEPDGENLEVWNKIKDNGDIAYFLHKGDFKIPSYKSEEREKLRQEIEQILIDHPNSFYAQAFKRSLEKFQVMEEERKACVEKMKAKEPKY